MKYTLHHTAPQSFDLSKIKLGDTEQIELCSFYPPSETTLLITKTGKNKFSIVRQLWEKKGKKK